MPSICRQHYERETARMTAEAAADRKGGGAKRPASLPAKQASATDAPGSANPFPEPDSARVAGAGGPADMEGVIHGQMLALLRAHEASLKAVKSIERKVAMKRMFLPEYADYLSGVLEADTGLQDNVVSTLMVWHLDCADYAGVAPLARYVLHHQLALPERFSRDAVELVIETLAEAVIAKENPSDDMELTALLGEVIQDYGDGDMADEIRAKASKATGLILHVGLDEAPTDERQPWIQAVLEHFEMAQRLNPKSGLKRKIDALRKMMEADQSGTDPDGAPGSTSDPAGDNT